jgi:hypothetical protein
MLTRRSRASAGAALVGSGGLGSVLRAAVAHFQPATRPIATDAKYLWNLSGTFS